MKLEIEDPKTGETRIVYDLSTGIYTTQQINSEFPTLTRGDKSHFECRCIDDLPAFSDHVEQIIKEHVKQDLVIDFRPDGYRKIVPKLETIKELSGIMTIRNNIFQEESYNPKQYITSNLDTYSIHEVAIDNRFQPEDKLIIWHTHPTCDPTGSTDVKAFKEIASTFERLNPQNCYDVRYIPKMNIFYWFTLKRKPFLRRLFRC